MERCLTTGAVLISALNIRMLAGLLTMVGRRCRGVRIHGEKLVSVLNGIGSRGIRLGIYWIIVVPLWLLLQVVRIPVHGKAEPEKLEGGG